MSDTATRPTTLAEMTLDELAERTDLQVIDIHNQLNGVLAAYINVGETLLEVRSRMSANRFQEWADCRGFSHSMISNSMRLAAYKTHLPDLQTWTGDDGKVRNMSINKSLAYVRGLPPVNPRAQSLANPGDIAEAKRLIEGGMSSGDVGAILGVSKTTIRNWCDPKKYRAGSARRASALRESRRQSKLAAKALKEKTERQQRDRLAKATGGELSAAYANIRKALAALDKAGSPLEIIATLHRAESQVVDLMRVAA